MPDVPTAAELMDLGYPDGETLQAMLARLEELRARGVTGRKYYLKLLAREFGEPPPPLAMRGEPLPWTEAIEASITDRGGSARMCSSAARSPR